MTGHIFEKSSKYVNDHDLSLFWLSSIHFCFGSSKILYSQPNIGFLMLYAGYASVLEYSSIYYYYVCLFLKGSQLYGISGCC
jgi:hypothetical protein